VTRNLLPTNKSVSGGGEINGIGPMRIPSLSAFTLILLEIHKFVIEHPQTFRIIFDDLDVKLGRVVLVEQLKEVAPKYRYHYGIHYQYK